jgi:TRAP transporter 4TM/12TM fusion protein
LTIYPFIPTCQVGMNDFGARGNKGLEGMAVSQRTEDSISQAILNSYKESRLDFLRKAFIVLIGLSITLFHLYANSWWGFFSGHIPRILHWTALSGLTFLIFRTVKTRRSWWGDVIDWVLFAVAIASGLYILMAWQDIVISGGYYSQTDAVVSMILVLVILEATRRGVSAILAITAAVFIAYALWGHLLPGFFGHRRYDLFRVFAFLAVTPEAVFGIPIGVSATYIIMFIIFSAMLGALGGSGFFIDLAFAVTGRLRGGPAKAAVVSSALVGTISGSSTANVVTTGTFTIPLMKQAGYQPNVAGAIEAVASTGGQITPPIMGAAAFLIAEMTNTPYITICFSAVIPAFLYFFATYLFVDLEARRAGMAPRRTEDLPKFWIVMKERGFLILPLFTLFGFMVYGYSPMYSVFLSMLALVAISFLSKKTRPGWLTIPKALIQASRNAIPMACACASAGIIMGIINLTGIGVKFSALITEAAGTHILLSLFFTMLACMVLGCGMPTTAVYVIVAVLAGPSLIEIGIPPLIAHMFIFYYGCTAPITPPVAMSSYAAAAIAQGDPMEVALKSVKIGFVAFVLPYMLVYFPQLMMMGSPLEIAIATVTALAGIILLSAGLVGFLFRRCIWWERVLCFVAGALLFKPGLLTDLVGFILGILIVAYLRISNRRQLSEAQELGAVMSNPSISEKRGGGVE